jgi:hypothetical protein
VTNSKDTPAINTALADLRSRRLAKESAMRAKHADALANQRADAAAHRRELLAKFDQFDRAIAEIRSQLTVAEKSLTVAEKAQSALAHQPPQRTQ